MSVLCSEPSGGSRLTEAQSQSPQSGLGGCSHLPSCSPHPPRSLIFLLPALRSAPGTALLAVFAHALQAPASRLSLLLFLYLKGSSPNSFMAQSLTFFRFCSNINFSVRFPLLALSPPSSSQSFLLPASFLPKVSSPSDIILLIYQVIVCSPC